jgi:hypothetical protein
LYPDAVYLGADMIKVERPGGDENRFCPPLGPDGQNANFDSGYFWRAMPMC